MVQGIDTLRSEIVRQAEKQAKEIVSEAEKEASRLMDDARDHVASYQKTISEKTKAEITEIKKKELNEAELEAKRVLLERKKALIEGVFDSVAQKIEKLSAKERKSLITSLDSRVRDDITVGRIYCNKKDSSAIKKVSVSQEDILGGLIAESKDGAVRVDYSFETILGMLREHHLKDLVRILFK